MGIIFRKSTRLGPVKLNFGKRGFTSWGLVFGPWSWNSRTRSHRVDLPGPFSWSSKASGSSRLVKVMLGLGVFSVGGLATLVFILADKIGL